MKAKSRISAIAFLVLTSYALAADAPVKIVDGMLVGQNGMTLYTFDKDVIGSGQSVCNGPCAVNWPPLIADSDGVQRDNYTIITRDNGMKQWAFKGMPLYFWIKDQKPGDKTGDGFHGVWHIVKP